jgi:hypothetical protein
MRYSILAFFIALVSSAGFCAAADTQKLIDDLADDTKRAAAIEALLKLGNDAEADLRKAEMERKLENERQLLLVRRLQGEIQVRRSPLKPIDMSTLKHFGESKEEKTEGDPDLLLDRDEKKKLIVMNGEFILEGGPLEYLVVSFGPGAKLHETVLAVKPRPHDICYALLACNYVFAGELGIDGTVNLPENAGVLMSVEFEWETPNPEMKPVEYDAERQPIERVPPASAMRTVRVPIEYFAWNTQTERPMKRVPFAFTGSKFETDPETNKKVFMADVERSLAAVKLDPYAVLNSPLNTRSVNPLHENGYSVNWRLVPRRKTKCKLVFEPYTGPQLTEEDLKDTGDNKGKGVTPDWAQK